MDLRLKTGVESLSLGQVWDQIILLLFISQQKILSPGVKTNIFSMSPWQTDTRWETDTEDWLCCDWLVAGLCRIGHHPCPGLPWVVTLLNTTFLPLCLSLGPDSAKLVLLQTFRDNLCQSGEVGKYLANIKIIFLTEARKDSMHLPWFLRSMNQSYFHSFILYLVLLSAIGWGSSRGEGAREKFSTLF